MGMNISNNGGGCLKIRWEKVFGVILEYVVNILFQWYGVWLRLGNRGHLSWKASTVINMGSNGHLGVLLGHRMANLKNLHFYPVLAAILSQFGTKTGPFLLKVWAICFWKYIQLRLWGQILSRGNRVGVRPVLSHSSAYWHCHGGYY